MPQTQKPGPTSHGLLVAGVLAAGVLAAPQERPAAAGLAVRAEAPGNTLSVRAQH